MPEQSVMETRYPARWRDWRGDEHRLEDMSNEYLINVINMLKRKQADEDINLSFLQPMDGGHSHVMLSSAKQELFRRGENPLGESAQKEYKREPTKYFERWENDVRIEDMGDIDLKVSIQDIESNIRGFARTQYKTSDISNRDHYHRKAMRLLKFKKCMLEELSSRKECVSDDL